MPSNLICMMLKLALVHQPDRRIYKGGQTPLCSGSNMLLNTEFKGTPLVNVAPLFLSSCDTFIWWHWNEVQFFDSRMSATIVCNRIYNVSKNLSFEKDGRFKCHTSTLESLINLEEMHFSWETIASVEVHSIKHRMQ